MNSRDLRFKFAIKFPGKDAKQCMAYDGDFMAEALPALFLSAPRPESRHSSFHEEKG